MDAMKEILDMYLCRYHYRTIRERYSLSPAERTTFTVVKATSDTGCITYRVSKVLMNMCERFTKPESSDPEAVSVIELQCSKCALEHVLEFLEYHSVHPMAPIEKPLRGKLDDVICEWDRRYLNTDLIEGGDERLHSLLMDVLNAAHILKAKDLVDLTCAAVASMIKGKSPDDIRQLFNVENEDFTPEEVEKIREENRWCEES